MGIDFKIKDFVYPLEILKLRKTFDRNQWLSREQLQAYQLHRLHIVLKQAFQHVPYYQGLFRKAGIHLQDIKSLSDLNALTCLSKADLVKNFQQLTALNFQMFRPQLITTSGTTGNQVRFFADKPSNILEFVFYWRYWGWAGYRLGNTFAELSAEFFMPYDKFKNVFGYFQPLTRRLMVNSLLIGREQVAKYNSLFKKYRPLFIKGLPSNLYCLAQMFHERIDHGISFKAVFSQGENLLLYQKKLIEQVFNCRVFDHYGHMERTVAISQCSHGSYHIHMDYGIAEFEKNDRVQTELEQPDEYVAEVIGTSLHNLCMPLIRYRTGDYVKLKKNPERCPCNRNFPTVVSILGRDCDIVYTPDGRSITALYVVFDRTPGLSFAQIIQEKTDLLLVRAVIQSPDKRRIRELLLNNIRKFTGKSMRIQIEEIDPGEVEKIKQGKVKVVVSKLSSPEHKRRELQNGLYD
jgi:phenylacetate-CoA ligase